MRHLWSPFVIALCLVTFSPAVSATQSKSLKPPSALQQCKQDNVKLLKTIESGIEKLAAERIQKAEDRIKRSEGEIPYLGAAYVALWLVLFGFVFSWKRSQRKLEIELHELRARLEAAEDDGNA